MRCLFAYAITFALSSAAVAFAQEAEVAANAPAATETSGADSASLAEIEKAINSYVAAFNKGDAAALAKHFTEAGEMVTPSGVTISGRGKLEESFAKYFEEATDAKIELLETSVELLSPGVGIETGIARVIAPEREPTESVYEAIHIMTAEGWKVDRVSETNPPATAPSHREELQALDWMVGSWENGDANSAIETTCRWTPHQNFLVQTFRVYVADRVDFEGTQVIGWDPYEQTIRSWLFDSDGGFGVGRWSEGDGRWTVATLNVLPDGRRGSSTNVYELVDDNTVRFSSVGRQVDGELLPSIEPVDVVRVASE